MSIFFFTESAEFSKKHLGKTPMIPITYDEAQVGGD